MTTEAADTWTIIAAVGQVVGALATAWAVIVTLRIVRSERRPILRLRADLAMAIGDGRIPTQDVIVLSIANVGVRRCKVTALSWRTGRLRKGPRWLRHQYAVQMPTYLPGSPAPPITLEPGDEVSITIDPAPFVEDERKQMREEFFCRQAPWDSAPRPTSIEVGIDIAAHGAVFQRVGANLAHLLATGRIEKGAAEFDRRADARRKGVAA